MIGLLIFGVLVFVAVSYILKRQKGSGPSMVQAPAPTQGQVPVPVGTPPAPQPNPTPAPVPSSLAQEIVAAHNKLRSLHGVPPLVWDESLAQFALNHANTCVFAHTSGPYGENLAAGYPSATESIQAWYDEIKDYDYNNPGFAHGTGHFTQVVWKSTQKVGGAFVSCNGRNGTPGAYLVCEYSPPGNVTNSGYFAANVPRPK